MLNRCTRAKNNGGFRKHGLSKSTEYNSWMAMLTRCYNKNWVRYDRYGGRGIKVCDRWLTFINFIEDMGEKPNTSDTLERIKNDEDYKPENCRWASRKEQSINTRRNAFVMINGTSTNITKALQLLSIPRTTFYRYLRSGLSYQQAIDKLIQRSRSAN